MKFNLRSSIFVTLAIACGVIVLLGYFLPFLSGLRETFLGWAVILGAVLLLVGVIQLARVHLKKFSGQQDGAWYSLVLILSLGLTLIVALAGYWIGDTRLMMWLFNYVQVPIETSLMAILAVVLAYAVIRMLSRRMNLFSTVFIVTVLLVLIGTVSIPGLSTNILGGFRDWIVSVAATAGARGILLGVALGTIATGLRVLMGADRPYGD
jgi:hypothetical protein